MSSIAPAVVSIQTSPESVPSTPSWLGEVAIMGHYLARLGLLEEMAEHVRFARQRLGISGLWSLPDSPEELKKESHFC